jgi:phage terminase small subunit
MKDNLAETAEISPIQIVNEHAKIAFSNITNLHKSWIERKEFECLTEDQKACIQEISTKVMKVNVGDRENPVMADVEYVRIKTYDKQKALDSLANLLGFNAPKKTELTGKNGKDLIPESDVEKMKNELFDLVEKIKMDS